MFGLGDNDEDQKFWNMIMFKVPMTNKELEEATPLLIICLVIVLIILGGLFLRSHQ